MKKRLEYFNEGVRISNSEGKGRGVFASKGFEKGDLIEIAPVITIPEKQWPFVQSTVLSDYFFENEDGEAVLALGSASLYNHCFNPNADYVVADGKILITSTREIKKGEEISIDYGWDFFHYYEKGVITKEQLEAALEEEEDDEDC